MKVHTGLTILALAALTLATNCTQPTNVPTFTHPSTIEESTAIVTYFTGEKCLIKKWHFLYKSTRQGKSKEVGGMIIHNLATYDYEQTGDVLRIVDGDENAIAIEKGELKRIRYVTTRENLEAEPGWLDVERVVLTLETGEEIELDRGETGYAELLKPDPNYSWNMKGPEPEGVYPHDIFIEGTSVDTDCYGHSDDLAHINQMRAELRFAPVRVTFLN